MKRILNWGKKRAENHQFPVVAECGRVRKTKDDKHAALPGVRGGDEGRDHHQALQTQAQGRGQIIKDHFPLFKI